MQKHYVTTILLCAGLFVLNTPAHAAIKCWQNKDNIRECGQIVPQEYSQQRIEVLNSKGVVVRVIERARTPEEQVEYLRQQELQKAKQRELAAKKRKDLILLQTYTTEKDLLLARKQNLRAIDGIISITESNTKTIEENLAVLKKRAADYERAGEQPSQELLTEMENLKSQVHDNKDFTRKKLQAKQLIEAKFDADLKRFRELKGIKPGKASNKK